ncbi:MAG: ribonuclease P protein component [Hyphomicrobiaceae bacterium]
MITANTQPAEYRLRSQRDFRSVYGRGRRASGAWLTVVVWLRRPGEIPAPRIGLSVSKDHGGAVRRNKLKRVLREAFRMERVGMPANIDVVLIPKKRDDNMPLAEIRVELPALIEKALRAPKRPPRRRPR